MNIIKKIYFYLPLIFSIFFLFCSNVKADTTITFPSDYNTFYENNISSLISYGDTKLSSLGSSYTGYFIMYNPFFDANYRIQFYFIYNNQVINWKYQNSSFQSVQYPNGNTTICRLDYSDFSEITCYTSSNQFSFPFPPVYSTFDIPFYDFFSNSPFIFVSGSYSTSITVSSDGTILPTYYSLYQEWHQEPPDSYPLLTSFYSIFIEKLSLLCEYVYTNYIFLSIFVVLIIYFSILLLRRLK